MTGVKLMATVDWLGWWLFPISLIVVSALVALLMYRRTIMDRVQATWEKLPSVSTKQAVGIGKWILASALVIATGIATTRHFGWLSLFPIIAFGTAIILWKHRPGISILLAFTGAATIIVILAISLPIFEQSHQEDDNKKITPPPATQPPAQTTQEQPPADTDDASTADPNDQIVDLTEENAALKDELKGYREGSATTPPSTAQAPATTGEPIDNSSEYDIEKPLASARPEASPAGNTKPRAPYTGMTVNNSGSPQTSVLTNAFQRVGDVNFIIQDCHRKTRTTIECHGTVDNSADRPIELSLEESRENSATDNLGNRQTIYRVGGISFGDDWTVVLEKNIPTNFLLRFDDRSLGTSTSTSIKLGIRVDGTEGETRPFNPVRIQ
jgi:hypothetical protein